MNIKLYGRLVMWLCITTLIGKVSVGQNTPTNNEVLAPNDSLSQNNIATTKDSVDLKIAAGALNDKVTYNAQDSIIYDITNQKIYLYGKADVSQDKIQLKAGEIVFDNEAKIMTAVGLRDSLGEVKTRPVFTEGTRSFESDTIIYNFETQKGRLKHLVTQEGEGYLHGKTVKKNEHDELFCADAYYTTCDLEHPHFKIEIDKVKVVPNKYVVSGPAQLVVADVPTPLVLPFGIFPLYSSQTSGLLLPAYSYSPNFGYSLQNGGYYFGFNDFVDLALTGDIYTNGSWGANSLLRYKRRYKYNGNLSLDFQNRRTGDRITNDFQVKRDFWVRWSHSQDGKARPNSNFSANVNAGTSDFNREYQVNNSLQQTNTVSSNINYRYTIPSSPFSMSLNARFDQNTNTKVVNATLPQFNLTMRRIFPFKGKIGDQNKWYQKIGITYNFDAQAKASIADSLVFTKALLDATQYGAKQDAAISTDFRLFKYINIKPSANYTQYFYPSSLEKIWEAQSISTSFDEDGKPINDTIPGFINTDTLRGFRAPLQFNTSVSATTKLYGTVQFKKGKLRGLRHEMTPSLSFSYRPDFSDPFWKYYAYVNDNYVDGLDNLNQEYSVFGNGIYGSPASGQNASIGFSLNNLFQAKIYTPNDTSSEDQSRKIKLLDRINFTTSYNLLADSLNLAPIRFATGTNFFNKIRFDLNGQFDAYKLSDSGIRMNEWVVSDFNIQNNWNVVRFSSATLSLRTSFTSDEIRQLFNGTLGANGGQVGQVAVRQNNGPRGTQEKAPTGASTDYFVIKSFNIDYNLGFRQSRIGGQDTLLITTNTLNVTANVALTPQWRINITSGYDFKDMDFAYTTLRVQRDLHCWQLSFDVVPFGTYRSYYIVVRPKASIIQDLKIERRRRWQDL